MRSYNRLRVAATVLAVALLAIGAWGQDHPTVNGVDPGTAKAGDKATITGVHLAKPGVIAVFLSSTTEDFPAIVQEQSETKIVIKIPKVKPGDYNVSIQVDKAILIMPVHVKIEE